MTEPSLSRLRKEVDKLKKQKIQKVALATTLAERDKLLREIKELEVVKKTPSKLKSFGRTYLRGLKITGGALWRGIRRASRNLDKNAPEYRELSRGMTKRPTMMKPYSPMAEMYVPKAKPYYSTTPRKMKASKLKKRKQVKKMKRTSYSKKPKRGFRITDKATNPWDLP